MRNMLLCLLALCYMQLAYAQKIDEKALQRLVAAAKASHSAGLCIWVDGKLYKNYVFDDTSSRCAAYSATKSIIALAVGKLVTDGQLSSIDTPVYAYYPEWKQGLKKTITIRHLLSHTSAMRYVDADPDGWEPQDIIRYALSAELVDTPGHYFLYNDQAVRLLHGVIEKIAGMPMDVYINKTLFSPLGIADYHWEHDQAGHSNLLYIAPAELVKMGQLVLDKGRWQGRPLIARAWIDTMLAQGQPFVPNCGLLWWRIPEKILYVVDDELLEAFRQAGVSEAFIQKFSTLKGEYENVNIAPEKLVATFGANWNAVLDKELYPYYPRRAKWGLSDTYIGYKAEGWLGQYLVVYPHKKIVACRMVRNSDAYNEQTDAFQEFEKLVLLLRP